MRGDVLHLRELLSGAGLLRGWVPRPDETRTEAACSALVLSIGLIYHTWLVKVFLEPGENLSNLFRPAQVCHRVGDGIVVSELQQG